ncbi:MAG: hypothetical protein K9J17_05565 [Flavobacteriales bacterium]|nr:hypothetical protein [Flavobacteriales bacterium]
MNQQERTSIINANRILLCEDLISEKGGILNAITYASAQYLYKVLEKHDKTKLTRFDTQKTTKLKRTIIHKNAHLDEYFAELFFRAILPPHLKDIEVSDHVLMSAEDDSYARMSWSSGVVFGIHADESGGAKALAFYDEHHADGTRTKPSCSQLVAEAFYSGELPSSIQTVLDEVNYSDSHAGAHTYNIKNIISSMHDIPFFLGGDDLSAEPTTKYLTENWKRAIVDACVIAVIFCYENKLLPLGELNDRQKTDMERSAKGSLDYFVKKTLLQGESKAFKSVAGMFFHNYKVGNHKTIDNAIWKDDEGNKIKPQNLIVHYVCYSLYKCWGVPVANFVMMHLWQVLFQNQVTFREITDDIKSVTVEKGKHQARFGWVEKVEITEKNFVPKQRESDTRNRTLNYDSPLVVYNVEVTNPHYPNVATAVKALINADYTSGGNNGFGVMILNDKTINSKAINNGPTVPEEVWIKLSDKVTNVEDDRWFQLKNAEGRYADFLLNRTKAHQEHLPSEAIDLKFVVDALKEIAV